jgi:hypothetical protein
MTSNLAQQEIAANSSGLRQEMRDENDFRNAVEESSSVTKKFMNHTIYPILRNHFQRDEFLGRINEVLLFLPFTDGELRAIVEMELRTSFSFDSNIIKILSFIGSHLISFSKKSFKLKMMLILISYFRIPNRTKKIVFR